MLLVALHAPGGFTAERRRMPERLAVKTLSNGAGVLIFFPSYNAMAQFFELENCTDISIRLKRHHKNRVSDRHRIRRFVHFDELGHSYRTYVVGSQLFADVVFWYVGGYPFQNQSGLGVFRERVSMVRDFGSSNFSEQQVIILRGFGV
jgi:hypothetical protein